MKKIPRHQILVSDERLCQYGDIGDTGALAEAHAAASRQAEYGIRLEEWLETDEGAPKLVAEAWDALTEKRQIVILMELHSEAVRSLDNILECIREMCVP